MMQAIILVAGQGSRLRPLTDYCPKCLIKVQGKPILQYQLEALSAAGFRECVIVVGHLAALVRNTIGPRYRNLSITYVENEIYDRTNNIYSLWLSRTKITGDVLLLEGDLIFEPALLTDLLNAPCENAAVVDRFQPFMNGTVILARGHVADAMVLKRDQSLGFDYRAALKTVNIYKFSYQAINNDLMPALGAYIAEGATGDYYEMAIADLISNQTMRMDLVHTGLRAWAEIDTVEELADAERTRSWQWPRNVDLDTPPALAC